MSSRDSWMLSTHSRLSSWSLCRTYSWKTLANNRLIFLVECIF